MRGRKVEEYYLNPLSAAHAQHDRL